MSYLFVVIHWKSLWSSTHVNGFLFPFSVGVIGQCLLDSGDLLWSTFVPSTRRLWNCVRLAVRGAQQIRSDPFGAPAGSELPFRLIVSRGPSRSAFIEADEKKKKRDSSESFTDATLYSSIHHWCRTDVRPQRLNRQKPQKLHKISIVQIHRCNFNLHHLKLIKPFSCSLILNF